MTEGQKLTQASMERWRKNHPDPRAEMEVLSERIVLLRGALIESGNASGGRLTVEASDGFLMNVPPVVRGTITALRVDVERFRKALEHIAEIRGVIDADGQPDVCPKHDQVSMNLHAMIALSQQGKAKG